MITFGDYESVQTLTQSIRLGRLAGTVGEADVCIKAVALPEGGYRNILPAKELLLSAAFQQAAAEHSPRWAPVVQLGSDDNYAFAITRRYPRSLQTLINQRHVVSAFELRRIMLAIIEALIDIEHALGQPHGNLKPANVFLAGESSISPDCVRLSDPDPMTNAVPSLARPSDVRCLGQILFALVTSRSYALARHPLTDFEPWKQLGRGARRWFSLCNQMLAWESRANLVDLAQLRMQITAINPARRRAPVAVLTLLAVGMLAVSGYATHQRWRPMLEMSVQRAMRLIQSGA